MSTRATYAIKSGRKTTTFYGHYDGYLEGAANRFHNALVASFPSKLHDFEPGDLGVHSVLQDRPRGGFAFAFIRGNEDIEPTANHDAHGDTEYQYTYDEKTQQLTVRTRNHETWEWIPSATWDIVDFLSSQYCSGEDDNLVGKATYQPKFGPPETFVATVKIARKLSQLADAYAATFKTDNPNKAIYEELARTWSAVCVNALFRYHQKKAVKAA